jgi:hypothetical protein
MGLTRPGKLTKAAEMLGGCGAAAGNVPRG